MLVLRIETPGGKGPYQSDLVLGLSAAANAHRKGNCPQTMRQHPTPENDPLMMPFWEDIADDCDDTIPLDDAKFGFASQDQYHAWFSTHDSRRILKEAGYLLSIYRVPDEFVLKGSTQVVYNKLHAYSVARLEATLGANQLRDILFTLY